jgi:hypothetical protein
MGRMHFVAFAAAVVLLSWTPPVQAAGLDCMAGSYSKEDRLAIEAAGPGLAIVDSDEDAPNPASDLLAAMATAAAMDCFTRNEWPVDAAYHATIFELGRLFEQAFRTTGALSPEELAVVDAALAESGHERLWNLLERGAMAGLNGTDPNFTTQENFIMGAFAISLGLERDSSTDEDIGILLGFMSLQRLARREFSALVSE